VVHIELYIIKIKIIYIILIVLEIFSHLETLGNTWDIEYNTITIELKTLIHTTVDKCASLFYFLSLSVYLNG